MEWNIYIKYLHICAAAIVFLFLTIRSYPILIQGQWQETSTSRNKIIVGCQHLGYSFLILTGLWLASAETFHAAPWFYAKIILFLVMLSASIKAFNRRKVIPISQRRAGLTIAFIAFFALLSLVLIKPQFGV